jgi:hypothetical protein
MTRAFTSSLVLDHGLLGSERVADYFLIARNIKGAHFAVVCGYSHHHLPKGAPL